MVVAVFSRVATAMQLARRQPYAPWGGRRFREQGKDISLIYFGQISDVPTEDLREISSLREAAL